MRSDGYEVIAVSDGRRLLDRILGALNDTGGLDGIDLILSDIRMPQLDALMIMNGMRAANVRVPVLLMTAFGDPDTHERAVQLGARYVMNKPFEIDDLRMILCNALDG